MATNMSFTDGVTVIPADWLNFVNTFVNGGGGGSSLPIPVPIVDGGTGTTTATGTGSVVLQNNPTLNTPTLTTPVLNTPTVNTPAITGGSVDGHGIGYKEIPQNSQGASYTLVLADSAKFIYHPSGDVTARTYSIPDNSVVAFPIGTELSFVNDNGAGAITIAMAGSDTMRLAGTGTLGNRTLAANGMASALKLTATTWIINGTNLT